MATLMGGIMLPLMIYYTFAASLFLLVAIWVIHVKAGWPGWTSLIPVYNYYVLLQIAGKPWWWLLLSMILPISIVIFLLHCLALAESFGRGALFGIGLFCLAPIFIPILAFSDIEYAGAD